MTHTNYIEIFQVGDLNYNHHPVQDEDVVVINTPYMDPISHDIHSFTDFMSMINYSTVNSGLLPPGVKFMIPGFVVFERPPTMKLIQYIDHSVENIHHFEEYGEAEPEYDEYGDPIESDSLTEDDMKINSYYVPVPWQLYMVTYSLEPSSLYHTTSVNMFFMNGPLASEDTILYSPYVFNFYSNGLLCSPMFSDYEEINRYPKNITGVISSAYDWVWNTGFNRDLTDCVSATWSRVDNPITKLIRYNMKYDHDYNSFFNTLSTYSPEDVLQYSWLNPTFATWYSANETKYIFKNRHDIVEKFAQEVGLQHLSVEEIINSSDYVSSFQDWYAKEINSRKTYKDMILKMFFHGSVGYEHQDYRSLIEFSSNVDIINKFYSYGLSRNI